VLPQEVYLLPNLDSKLNAYKRLMKEAVLYLRSSVWITNSLYIERDHSKLDSDIDKLIEFETSLAKLLESKKNPIQAQRITIQELQELSSTDKVSTI
jgi:predicted nucleotidyltransferase